ncbi:MAG: hypothetical protein ACYDC8_05325 [Gammaproteobacteria bacterium]
MTNIDRTTLSHLAAKYIWWKTPQEAVRQPARVAAQVMELGDYDDVQLLSARLGDDYLREVLARAEAGWFSPRSWAYWHYRLGVSRPGQLPAMPQRRIA